MKTNDQDIQTVLQQISYVLLMNGGFLSNPGLYTGEMGLVLFFTRYAHYTKNDLYLDYAYDLMEKLQNRIHCDTPITYKQGLAGIGSAIEYLVQNNFFEADTDEILEDFDQQIFFTYNLPYLSIEKLLDIGYYAIWRISGSRSKKDMIQQTILPQIEKVVHDNSVIPAWHQLHQRKTPTFLAENTYSYCLELIAKNIFLGKDMGLDNGLAGWGMSLLTEIDDDNSWISLFPNDFIPSKNESLSV